MQRSLENAADCDAAKVVRVVEIGYQNLQRAFRIAGGGGNGRDDSLEQWLQVHARLRRIECRCASFGHRVEHWKIQLTLVRIEVDEQVVDFVQYFLRSRVGPVNLVNHHDGQQFGFKRLCQHVARLRKRPLCGINQEHHTVHHLQCSLHLTAKIRMARRIHNVDLAAFEDDGSVLGQDGDAALPLQLVRVHHPVSHLLVGSKGPGLPQHGVYQRRLSMINMGNDGDIAYRLAHKCKIPFLGFGCSGRQVGNDNGANHRTVRHFPFYQH